jgi:hypothetical protein
MDCEEQLKQASEAEKDPEKQAAMRQKAANKKDKKAADKLQADLDSE